MFYNLINLYFRKQCKKCIKSQHYSITRLKRWKKLQNDNNYLLMYRQTMFSSLLFIFLKKKQYLQFCSCKFKDLSLFSVNIYNNDCTYYGYIKNVYYNGSHFICSMKYNCYKSISFILELRFIEQIHIKDQYIIINTFIFI